MAKSEKAKTANAETETENQNDNSEVENKAETQTADNGAIDKSINAIGDTLAQSMPEVQEHAIEQERGKQEAAQEAHKGITDRQGTPFDPAIHKTNKQGEPTLTAHGNCIRKPAPRGEKKQTGGSVIGGKATQAQPQNSEEQAQKVQARASGTMAANLLITMGIVAGGEEWRPRKDAQTGRDEKSMLEGAFADYFEATGKTDLPPSMTLVVAIGAYSLPRFTMPKTKSRIGKFKQWIAKKIADRKLRKHGLKAEKADNTSEG